MSDSDDEEVRELLGRARREGWSRDQLEAGLRRLSVPLNKIDRLLDDLER